MQNNIKTDKDVIFKTARDLKMNERDVRDIYNAVLKGLYDKITEDPTLVEVPLHSIGRLYVSLDEIASKNLLTGKRILEHNNLSDKRIILQESIDKYYKKRQTEIVTSGTKYQGYKDIKRRIPYNNIKAVKYYGINNSKNSCETLEDLEEVQNSIFYEEDNRYRK